MTQASLFDADDELVYGWGDSKLRQLQVGDSWPEAVALMPGEPSRCKRRRPGADPIYGKCDLTLGHDGDHAEVGFSDHEPRVRIRRAWAADPPGTRAQWLQYRREIQVLLDARAEHATFLEDPELSDEAFDAAVMAVPNTPVPSWEEWCQPLPGGSPTLGLPDPTLHLARSSDHPGPGLA